MREVLAKAETREDTAAADRCVDDDDDDDDDDDGGDDAATIPPARRRDGVDNSNREFCEAVYPLLVFWRT